MIKIYIDTLKGWQMARKEMKNLKPGDRIVITRDSGGTKGKTLLNIVLDYEKKGKGEINT